RRLAPMASCPACGKELPGEFPFCPFCAAPLAESRPAREQRKVVTVLFCDVTGSTALGERLDPESLRRVMVRYFEVMKQVVERHGGTVEKFIGDAVMAVFGVPALHEDDALRAVSAAAGMRDALEWLNEELTRDYDTRLELRIGVNTGEVVTGTEERLATGDAVNVAARLEQAAQPGEILLGEETLQLARDAIQTAPVAPLVLKGKAEPVAAHRLESVRAGAAAIERHLDAPIVGRETELRRLRDALDQAARDRSCQLFTILGAAGVGKSRLAHEFLSSLKEATVVRGRCLPYGEGISYWPVVEVLKQLEPRLPGLITDELALSVVRSLLGEEEASSSGEEIAWAFRKLLEGAAGETLLVCVFDDIHWGEETFFELVEHVADLSRDAPMLLLCMARPDLLDRRPGWGGGKLNATTVLLEALSVDETDELIERLLGQDII
ncbi:MAG: AAA family ATPase, partial [Gaiellaceae bacterium]